MLIGITGQARVGKTTIAKHLSAENPLDTYIRPFAAPLKAALVELTGYDISYFTDSNLKETVIKNLDITPRELMQKFGTEFVREMVSPTFWLWRMDNELSWIEHSASLIIIDDVRFENEAKFVRDRGGTILHYKRKDRLKVEGDWNNHISEQTLLVKEGDIIYDATGESPRQSVERLLRDSVFEPLVV